MLDGSRELAEIIRALHRSRGERPFSRDELFAVLRACVTSISVFTPARLDAYASSLVRCGYMVEVAASQYRLSERSAEFARSSEPLPDVTLSPEQEREFFALLSSNGAVESIPAQELHAVTRRFLEEVLHEAAIDPELLDMIVFTYQLDGKLTMSEDGGRYKITLPE